MRVSTLSLNSETAFSIWEQFVIRYTTTVRSDLVIFQNYTYMSVQALVFLLLELSLSLEFLELGLFKLLLVLATVNAVMNLRYPLNNSTLPIQ